MQLASDTNTKDELGGVMSIKFKQGNSFNDFCQSNIENYNPDRFEVLAIRVYVGKETVVTLYAIDKDRMEGDNFNKNKIPVKKFKLNVSFLQGILPYIENCNFTLTTENYPLEDMEVINK